MGVYDFLKGPCPSCGREIGEDSGDIQIDWFTGPAKGECFRTFRPGDELPVTMRDGSYPCGMWEWCCGDFSTLSAEVSGNKFIGFKRS